MSAAISHFVRLSVDMFLSMIVFMFVYFGGLRLTSIFQSYGDALKDWIFRPMLDTFIHCALRVLSLVASIYNVLFKDTWNLQLYVWACKR